ncbi:MAG: cache domain-containing protein [Cyanobacteria bacterium J06639_1]
MSAPDASPRHELPSRIRNRGARRVFAIALILSCLPAIGIGTTSQAQLRWLEGDIRTRLKRAARLAKVEVNSWLTTSTSALQHEATIQTLNVLNVPPKKATLEALSTVYPWFSTVFITDAEGNVIARGDGAALSNYSDRRYFQQVANGASVGRQVVIGRTTGQPALCIAVPIADRAGFQGAVVGCSTLNIVAGAIANTRIGTTGSAVLLDEESRAIVGGDFYEDGTTPSFRPYLDSNSYRPDRMFGFVENDRDILAYGTDIALGWTLIVRQDAAEALAPVVAARRQTAIFIAIAICPPVVLGISYWATACKRSEQFDSSTPVK